MQRRNGDQLSRIAAASQNPDFLLAPACAHLSRAWSFTSARETSDKESFLLCRGVDFVYEIIARCRPCAHLLMMSASKRGARGDVITPHLYVYVKMGNCGAAFAVRPSDPTSIFAP